MSLYTCAVCLYEISSVPEEDESSLIHGLLRVLVCFTTIWHTLYCGPMLLVMASCPCYFNNNYVFYVVLL